MPGKCVYNEVWNDNPEYKNWIAAVQDQKNKAFCRICKKELDLSRMGESALKVHAKGKKHVSLLDSKAVNNRTIKEFLSTSDSKPASQDVTTGKDPSVSSSSLNAYVIGKDVLDAEIKWALKCVTNHYSFNSCDDVGALFREMFPDSQIARQFTCGATKCAYLVCFGLAPYFKSILMDVLNAVPFYVLSFDETLNKSLQEKQMDIYVRYWNSDCNKVEMRFFTSVFMGHATADVLLNFFREATQNLKLNKILQISMDGPSVNWKFFNLLQKEIKTSYNCEILNTGSCGLHTLNNAFKYGQKISGWDLDNLLSSLYYLFKDSPARTEDYLKNSDIKKMPKSFCKHRWLENVQTAERAILIWDDIKKYIKLVECGKLSKPTSKSFSNVQKMCKDVLIPVKINFFLSVAKYLKPFLTIFQGNKPLLPFLTEELRKLVVDCMSYFCVMKKESILGLNSVLKVSNFDFTDKTCYSSISEISTGFVGDRIVKDLRWQKKVSDKELVNLKLQCQEFIFAMVIKLLEKSPIQYSFVRCMICLDPKHMVVASSDCYKKMKHILQLLVEANHLAEKDCEEIILQFNNFLNTVVLPKSNEFLEFNFSGKEARLDTFLEKYFREERHRKVWCVIQNLLILSHGQADIERGFSINKVIETENLHHETYIAQRIVLDYIKSRDIATIKIDKKLRLACSGARQKYVCYLSEKKNEKNEEEGRKRKTISDEIENLKSKKARLQLSINDLQVSADNLADKAEKTGNIKFVCQSNSFRRTVKEKMVELQNIDLKLNDSLLKLKK